MCVRWREVNVGVCEGPYIRMATQKQREHEHAKGSGVVLETSG